MALYPATPSSTFSSALVFPITEGFGKLPFGLGFPLRRQDKLGIHESIQNLPQRQKALCSGLGARAVGLQHKLLGPWKWPKSGRFQLDRPLTHHGSGAVAAPLLADE